MGAFHTRIDPVERLERLGRQFPGPLVVAASGGSDSTALLVAAAHAKKSGAIKDVVAVTIDHALRSGSETEAGLVADLSARLGLLHLTKRWEGPKPSSAIQAQARHARRSLLVKTAAEIGAGIILTGHTLNDQVETVAMRQKRGDGPGIAGIAPASLAFNDHADGSPVWIVRPLLDVSRDDLRCFLRARMVQWLEDPSNNNPAFERVSVRRELEASGPERFMALQYSQTRAAQERRALAQEASRLTAFYVAEAHPGLLRIDRGIFQAANLSGIKTAIRVLVAFAGGSVHAAGEDVANHIVESALKSGFAGERKPSRRTASGALIDIRHDGVWLMRERRKGMQAGLPFDGRYRSLEQRRVARANHAPAFGGQIAASLVQHVILAEPLHSDGNGTAVPAWQAAFSGAPLRRLINPWPDLVPEFDLMLAEKLSIIAGEGKFPACPIHPFGNN